MPPQDCDQCRRRFIADVQDILALKEEIHKVEMENLEVRHADGVSAIQASLSSGQQCMKAIESTHRQDIAALHQKIEGGWQKYAFPWLKLLGIFVPLSAIVTGAIIVMYAQLYNATHTIESLELDLAVQQSKCEETRLLAKSHEIADELVAKNLQRQIDALAQDAQRRHP